MSSIRWAENTVTGRDVVEFLGRDHDDEVLSDRATQGLLIVMEFVRAYVRGHGFDLLGQRDLIDEPLRAVTITATARMLENPTNLDRVSLGDFSTVGGGLQGFTLPELAVLHLYRRRTT